MASFNCTCCNTQLDIERIYIIFTYGRISIHCTTCDFPMNECLSCYNCGSKNNCGNRRIGFIHWNVDTVLKKDQESFVARCKLYIAACSACSPHLAVDRDKLFIINSTYQVAGYTVVPTCQFCGESAGVRCSGCKEISYCNRTCQVNDWQEHQLTCVASPTAK